MARIIAYPSANNVKSTDLLLGTQPDQNGANQTNPTKNFSVQSVVQAGLNPDYLAFNGLSVEFIGGSTGDPEFRVDSTRTDGNWPAGVRYTKLGVNFNNLVLDTDSTYKLIMDRWKRGKIRKLTFPQNWHKSRFRRQNVATMLAPYDERVTEIEITATSGQLFDFKTDFYYSSSTTSADLDLNFPRAAGFPKIKDSLNYKTTQYFQFFISKTDNSTGDIEYSQPLGIMRLIGVRTDAGVDSITWAPY